MEDSILIKPHKEPICAAFSVPGSKSITNRALLIAAMSEGESVLKNVLFSDDSRAFLNCLAALGFDLSINEHGKTVRVKGGSPKNAEINVGSAGTAARFLTAYLAASGGDYVIRASRQMESRPMKPLFDTLALNGVDIQYLGNNGFLPVRLRSCGLDCKNVSISSNLSSQFISALIMTAPLFKNGLTVTPEGGTTSASYIKMTMKIMNDFGVTVTQKNSSYTIAPNCTYTARAYDIEPDVSAACYFYAAACLTGGSALVKGVFPDSVQGDLRFLSILREMGCSLIPENEGLRLTAPDNGVFSGPDVDMNGCSDQTMTLAALAPFASSMTRIRNINHIRNQECDRIHAITTELTRIGVKCRQTPDGIEITPKDPKPAVIETYNDHRMAMAFALIGLRTPGIRISNPACVSKTFEGYFDTPLFAD